ncbi:MAG TPA: DUF5132 domain-containing protein [Balneolaceae bacterium]|nr:DUF5132 domain-containing protein [Balneolaceae bacterium]
MSLFEKIGESAGGFAFGIGAVIAAPFVTKAARPVAKELIKGGMYLSDRTKEYIAESGEELADLIAEAKAEMEAGAKKEASE